MWEIILGLIALIAIITVVLSIVVAGMFGDM